MEIMDKTKEYQAECNKWFYMQLDVKIEDLMSLCKRKNADKEILSLLNNIHKRILKYEKDKGWV
jgi:hypothetical protein